MSKKVKAVALISILVVCILIKPIIELAKGFLLPIFFGAVMFFFPMDRKVAAFSIKNCTKDTLFFELLYKDALTDEIFCDRNAAKAYPDKVFGIDSHEGKKFLWLEDRTLPDSTTHVFDPFCSKETCYLYVIKWEVLTHYSLEEIRVKKLYDKRIVTKKDFHNRRYEYRENGV